MSNQPWGYSPWDPGPADGNAFLLVQDGPGGGCYYSGAAYGGLGGKIGVFPDGSAYKQSAAELRQYILSLESSRRIQDLSNVDFVRNVKPGDALLYNFTTGKWELQNFISGGEW
jgi:hypothetical protein